MTDRLAILGAWHGAGCRDRLIPKLAALGQRAGAIDLPGHGADPTPRGTVTLAACGKARRTPQPLAPLAEPVTLLPGFDPIPRQHVVCTGDRAILPAMQRFLARGADHVQEIAASHSPLLSDPRGRAARLSRIAA